MAEFGSGEQSLLRALREDEAPSELDRDRVARRLEAELSVALGSVALGSVAVGAALTGSTVAAKTSGGASVASSGVASSGAALGSASVAGSAASATPHGLFAWSSVGALKWALLGVALGAASVGAVHWGVVPRASRAPNERSAAVDSARLAATAQLPGTRAAAAPVAAAPVATAPSVPAPSGEHDQLATAAPVEVAKASPAPASTPRKIAGANDLEAELALITDAQSALAAGAPQRALSALSEHARRFPTGTLVVERDALASIALCQSGQMSQGSARARRFAAKHPTSPLLARVRKACSMD